MSLFYRIAYRVGFTPWEEATRWAPAATQVAALLDRETSEHPAGSHALDLGCGRGHWALELARRGWKVTGIDRVAQAIAAARAQAAESGLSAEPPRHDRGIWRLELHVKKAQLPAQGGQ
jgi:methylase of polypeptide subunit release factors